MLVDDEADILYVLKNGLQSYGYTVDTFDKPGKALATDSSQYDIAIIDIRMPEINGFQLARSLWQRNEKLRICFLSAFEISKKEAEITLPNLKTHCFLAKPILPSKLSSHIQSHFIQNQGRV